MSNFSVVAAENDFLLNHPKFGSRRMALYPSEASVKYEQDGFTFVEGKCLRAAYYRLKGIPKDRGESISLTMKAISGKALEEATIDRWKSMGIWVGNNIKFFIPDFVVSGEIDAIIRDPNDGHYIGYELKSWDNSTWVSTKLILGGKKPPKPGEPREHQFLQAMTYAWEYRDQLPEFRMYYMDRCGGPRVEFRIGTELIDSKNTCWRENIPCKYWNYTTNKRIYYPYGIEDIHKRFNELVGYARSDQLPPKDYGYLEDDKIEYLYSQGKLAKKYYEPWQKDPVKNRVQNWECRYCDWGGRCKADSIEEVG